MSDRKSGWQLLLCAAFVCCCFLFPQHSQAEVVRTGYTSIVAANSGKCLSVYGAATYANGFTTQASCNSAQNQQWTVVNASQGSTWGFHIVEQQTGQCLDVYGASTAAGTTLVQNTCNGSLDEVWTFTPSGNNFQLVNQKSGMCASVQGASVADSADIIQATCSTAANFLWTVSSGLYTYASGILLQADHSGQCMGTYAGGTQVGSQMVQYPCDGGPDKVWQLFPFGTSYLLLSSHDYLCATVSGSGSSATIVQGNCTGSPGGLWNLTPVGGGYQLAVAQTGGMCLSVSGASQAPLAGLGLAACNGAQNSVWSLSLAKLPSAWSSIQSFPIVPAAVANLPNGQLVTWSAFEPALFEGDIGTQAGQTYTSVFDPVAGTATNVLVTNTGDDMFCPGTTNLIDGRILVNGGSSSPKTSIYDPASSTWITDAVMNIPRGYQGNTLLSSGTVLTMGGSWSGPAVVKTGEVWTKGAGWSVLSGLPTTNVLGTDADTSKDDNHLWLFAQANGTVFHAGPSAQMNWITTAGAGTITSAGNRGDDPYSINGKAVMYDVGMIMKTGGAPDYNQAAAEASTYLINIKNGTSGVAVTKIAPMAYPRTFANGTVLPNGQVVITGGQTYAQQWSDSNSVLIPEIWDPVTLVFRQLAPAQTPRNYHSTSILLQDGRVFAGGSGLCYFDCGAVNHLNAEILTPPYLLNADGSAATRPVISSAPTKGALGGTLAVSTTTPVVSFVLMRLSSATHSVNNDQRRIPLQLASTSGNSYTLSVPASSGVVLPGYYWIFAMNAQGVPSVGSTVLIN